MHSRIVILHEKVGNLFVTDSLNTLVLLIKIFNHACYAPESGTIN